MVTTLPSTWRARVAGVLCAALALLAPAVAGAAAPVEPRVVRLAMASSAAETGLARWLADDFAALNPGMAVELRSVGAIQALDLARRGEADVVITHHQPSEELFVRDGWGLHRTVLMYNDFAIFGPPSSTLSARNAVELRQALKQLANEQLPFVSPAPKSGTALKLEELWVYAGVTPRWSGYEVLPVSSREALATAAQTGSYAFADMSSYLAQRESIGRQLQPLLRDLAALRNYYAVIPVNGQKVSGARQELAEQFVDYLVSERGQQRVADFQAADAQAQLFVPAAHLDGPLLARRRQAQLEQQQRWMLALAAALAVTAGLAALAVVQRRRVAAGEARCRQSEQRYARAIAGTQDGIWEWDLGTGQGVASNRFLELLGLPKASLPIDEMCGLWAARVHPEDRPRFDALLQSLRTGAEDGHFEIEVRQLAGARAGWILVRGRYESGADGEPARVSGAVTDITAQRERDVFMQRALHDGLTGLPNRTFLQERLLQLDEQDEQTCAVLLLDLDGFKPINDELGHAVGDLVLVEVARRLKETVRGGDFVARLGGDEFVVLLPDTDHEGADRVVHHLQDRLLRPMTLEGQVLSVGASIGVAMWERLSANRGEVLKAADAAMYAAKRQRHAARAAEGVAT